MAYTKENFKTKTAFKNALKAGEKIKVYQPGGLFPDPVFPGKCCIEGPHYPAPHSWYAEVTLDDEGSVIKIK